MNENSLVKVKMSVILWGGEDGGLSQGVKLFLAGQECVTHQGAYCHRAYTAGDGADIGAQWGNLFELDITREAEPAFPGGVGDACCPDVDDDSPWLDHIGCDELRGSYGCDENISLTAFADQIARMAVADSHSGIAILLLHHELCHRLADNV